MEQYSPGEILPLKFPFTDEEAGKRRPALSLIDVGDDDVAAARITTHAARTRFDVEIKTWHQAGLKAALFIRLHKLATLAKDLVDRKLGKLTADDWNAVQSKLKELWESIVIEDAK